MKKILTALAAAIFLLLPITGFAAYVINLKDGTRFVTDQYFEEGDQIKFKRYGGLIGVERDRIREIEEIEDPPEPPPKKNETPAEASPPTGSEEKAKKKGPEKEAPTPDTSKQAAVEGTEKDQEGRDQLTEEQKKESRKTEAERITAFLEERRRLDREIKSAYSEFNEAKASKNKNAQKEHFDRLKSLRNKLTELEKAVKDAYGGKFPEWWNEAP